MNPALPIASATTPRAWSIGSSVAATDRAAPGSEAAATMALASASARSVSAVTASGVAAA